ncbi:MAG: hypothetical protein JRG91_13220 [Deltaproteobacteria bacterium]|nr:hypothetical protein [Deltaproteobacteria bacterium]
MRLLEAFAESLRRLIDLKAQGKPDEALDAVQETADQLFGSSLPLIDSLDAESAVDIIVEPEKVEMYARLAEEEAEILALLGHPDQAVEGRLRALEMFLERTRMSPPIDEEMKRRISELSSKVGTKHLDDRCRSLLDAVVQE